MASSSAPLPEGLLGPASPPPAAAVFSYRTLPKACAACSSSVVALRIAAVSVPPEALRTFSIALLSGSRSLSLSFSEFSVHLLFKLIDQMLSFVASFGQFELTLVFFGMLFGIVTHALDFFFRQAGALLDLHRRLLASAHIASRHVQDAVLVDVELDFNLRHTARCGGGMPSRLNSPSSRF